MMFQPSYASIPGSPAPPRRRKRPKRIGRWLYIAAASLLAQQLVAAQVAPPNFRALPGVGPFTTNQIGRWTGTKFQGGSVLEDSSGHLSITPAGTVNRFAPLQIGREWYQTGQTQDIEYRNALASLGTDSTTGIALSMTAFGDTAYSANHTVTLRGRGTHAVPTPLQAGDHAYVLEVNGIVTANPFISNTNEYTNMGALTCIADAGYNASGGGNTDAGSLWRFSLSGAGQQEQDRAAWLLYGNGSNFLPLPCPATANYGHLSIGGKNGFNWIGASAASLTGANAIAGGIWGGSASGHFAGNAQGTQIAVNSDPSFTGDFLNCEKGGIKRLHVDYNGSTFVEQTPDVTANFGKLNVGFGPWDGTTSGHFAGNAQGTIIAACALVGYTGNLVDAQVNGASKFSVDANGGILTGGRLGLGGTSSFASATGGVLALANATATPSGSTTGGGLLYVTGGALRFRGSSGTDTLIAAP